MSGFTKTLIGFALLTGMAQAAPVIYQVNGTFNMLPGSAGDPTDITVRFGPTFSPVSHIFSWDGTVLTTSDPAVSSFVADQSAGIYSFAFSGTADDSLTPPFLNEFGLSQANAGSDLVFTGSTPPSTPPGSTSDETCFTAPDSFTFTGGGYASDDTTPSFSLSAFGFAVVPELSPTAAVLPMCFSFTFLALVGGRTKRSRE
jgi:hypothetical protein